MWQGGGEFQTKDGKSAFDSPATVQALKFWQDAVNLGAAPRQVLGNGGSDTVANLGSGYCAMQNVGIWGISQLTNNAKDFPYGVFKLPTPPSGKYVTVGGGWAFVANAKGKNPDAAAEFCAWALASMDKGSVERVVDWCTKGKSDMPPRNSALEAGAAAFSEGMIGKFSQGDPSRHAGRTARAAGGLQDHLRRDPADAARRRRSAGDGHCRVASSSTRSWLPTAARRFFSPSSRWLAAPSGPRRGRLPLMLKKVPMAEQPAKSKRVAKRRGLSAKHREWLAGYLFVLPDALGLLVFLGLPMALSLVLGFFEVDGFGGYRFVGLANYARMVRRSAVLVGRACYGALRGHAGALALCLRTRRWRCWCSRPIVSTRVMRSMFFAPHMVSLVVVALVWQFMVVDKIGVVSRFAPMIGLGGLSFLGDPNFALITVVVVSVWFLMGFYMLIFLGGLQDIPVQYYEAAKIDGAGPVARFWYITLPLLKPTSFFVVMVSMVAAVAGAPGLRHHLRDDQGRPCQFDLGADRLHLPAGVRLRRFRLCRGDGFDPRRRADAVDRRFLLVHPRRALQL